MHNERAGRLGVLMLFSLAASVRPLPAADDKPDEPASLVTDAISDFFLAARVAQRDALWSQARELLQKGETLEAENAARKALEIERVLFGDDSSRIIVVLDLIAQCQAARMAWDEARLTRSEIVERSVALHGGDDYRVTDARRRLTDVQRESELTEDQHRSLSTAEDLSLQAVQFDRDGEYINALAAAERALEIRNEILGDRHLDTVSSLNQVAALHARQGDAAQAESIYKQALEISQAVVGNRHPDFARALNNLAGLYLAQGDYVRAEPRYREAIEICKEVLGDKHPYYATSLSNLGALYQAQRDYERAEALYQEALAVRKEVLGERHADYAKSLSYLAALYVESARYAQAEPLYLEALEIREDAVGERHPDYALSLSDLAVLYWHQGEYTRAEPLFRQALEIYKQALGERHRAYAISLNNLAVLYKDQGDYARAEPLYREALEIRKEIVGDRHAEYASSLNNLAVLYKEQGDYVRAEPLFRESLEICKEALGERHSYYAQNLHNLADLYRVQGNYALAEPLLRESLEIWEEIRGEGHPEYAGSLSGLAALYRMQGDYARAEPLFREALEIQEEVLGVRHPDYALTLHNLAVLYHAQADYARAEALYRQAVEIKKEVLGEQHPDYAISLNNLATTLADLNAPGEGLELSLQAAEIMNELLQLSSTTQSERQQLAMLQSAYFFSGNVLSLAQLDRKEAVDFYPALFTSKGQVFLRQRAIRQLRQSVEQNPESPAARTFAALTDRTRELDRLAKFVPAPDALHEHSSRLEELTLEVERLQQELQGLSDEFRESQESTSLTPDELTALLPTDAVLIDLREYDQLLTHDEDHAIHRVERQYAAFVMLQERPVEVIWLGSAEAINSAALVWREQFGSDLAKDAATRLRRLVWEPLEEHLDGISTVLISPDGGLNAIPFGALPGGEPQTYLIEERAFVTVPAPLLLPEILASDDTKLADPSLLLVGDVDYGSDPGRMELAATDRATAARGGDGLSNWDRLPDTQAEVEEIEETFVRTFDGAPTTCLSQADATEQAFRNQAQHASCLHLATHGYFAPPELKSVLSASRTDQETISLFSQQDVSGWHPGLLSGIVLAGANQPPDPNRDDGVLTALEVAELDLSGVELVTLSACETGLGKTAGGEGVLGLQRSFQLAGARTTVASLWEVPDAATRALMVKFYENLWQKKLPSGEALRQAQLMMLREGVDRGLANRGAGRVAEDEVTGRLPPYYWAAFVLSGDWR